MQDQNFLYSTIKDVVFCDGNVRIELTSTGILEPLTGKIDSGSILTALLEMVGGEVDDIKRISKITGALVEFTSDGLSILSIANKENGINIAKSGDNLVIERGLKVFPRK